MNFFLDTNIFLRYYIKDDEKFHSEVVRIIQKITNGTIKCVTSGVVLSEIVWVLGSYYHEPRQSTSNVIRTVLGIGKLKIVDNYDYRLATQFYEQFNIKFIDCLIASIPEIASKKWTIISYDRDFKKLPVLWKTPGDIK